MLIRSRKFAGIAKRAQQSETDWTAQFGRSFAPVGIRARSEELNSR